jgi:hypothetical protein
MFDHLSRYAALPTATLDLPDGRTVAYVRRRIVPEPASLPLLAEVAVIEGERIDTFTTRTLGDPLAFWQIADANRAMDPRTLTAEPGRRLRVPVPQVQG